MCAVCGKPVCDDCSVSRENKLFCDDVAHSALSTSRMKVAAAATEFEADMLVKNLLLNGVPALQFSAGKFSHFCRFADDLSFSIYVGNEFIEKARSLIEEMDLDEFAIHVKGQR